MDLGVSYLGRNWQEWGKKGNSANQEIREARAGTVRSREETEPIAGVRWSTLTSERWKGLGKSFVLQWTNNG